MASTRVLPTWLTGYRRSWLSKDVIGGLTVTALLVPEGMAYAQLAGMPPETAFYAAPLALVAYALLGSSRQLVVAVSSTVAIVSAATISELAPGGSAEFIALTAALAIMAGIVSLLAGVARLGRLAQFFSESVLTGFVFGLALIISVKQVPKVLGIEGEEGDFFERLWDILRHLGDAHGPTVVIGLGTIVLMLALERWFERIPAALVALIVGIVIGEAFDPASDDVEVVGEIPSGLVGPAIPDVAASDVTLLVVGALGIALISFAEAIGPARGFATEHGYDIDVNRELVGLGAANVGAGLFQGFPVGSSLSKSAANDRAGTRTPLSLFVAAGLTVLVALFFTGLFENLPEATLGAIVIVAVSGMMNVEELRRLWRIRRADFALAAVAMLGVLLFDALPGLGIAVLVSLAAVVWRAATPNVSVMGRPRDRPGYVSLERHPDARPIPGMLILRLDENLFFANTAGIREEVKALVDASEPKPDTVVFDLEATVAADVPACDEVREIAEELHADGMVLSLVRVHGPVMALFERAGVLEVVGRDRVFAIVLEAVAEHAARTGRRPDDEVVAERLATELRDIAAHLPGGSELSARLERAAEALEREDSG
jgi:high affinity sulfate transporter 1